MAPRNGWSLSLSLSLSLSRSLSLRNEKEPRCPIRECAAVVRDCGSASKKMFASPRGCIQGRCRLILHTLHAESNIDI